MERFAGAPRRRSSARAAVEVTMRELDRSLADFGADAASVEVVVYTSKSNALHRARFEMTPRAWRSAAG